jgi:hypothetical protein
MPKVGTVTHQPQDVMDYDISYADWIPAGDTITSATIKCEPTMSNAPSYAISTPVVKVWVYQGGVTGAVHKITVKATTAAGRVKEAELIVKIKEV